MIGVLVVTHGNLGPELLCTCEMIAGEQQNAEAIGLLYQDNIDELGQRVRKKIDQLDKGHGVIVFTDLYGGSPNSHTAVNLKNKDFQQITGVNMPMLLECFSMRESLSVQELSQHVKQVGIEGIKMVNEILNIK